MRLVALLALVGVSGLAVTTLPRPSFPGPVANAGAPTHMQIVSSQDVGPDVIVENSPESLATGADNQLEKALDVIKAV